MGSVLIRGGRLLTMAVGDDLPRREDLLLAGGVIAKGPGPADVTIDASGCLVLPGFVQGHLHLVQTLFRSAAEDLSLLAWLRRFVWPLEAAHDEETLRASARLGLAECIESGVTSIFDMGTTHGHEAILEEVDRSGIRGWSGKAMMDLDLDGSAPERLRESTQRSLDESEALASRFDGAGNGRLRYAYAPRFALSATPELHVEASRRAKETGRRIHTHAAETREETEAVRAKFGRRCIEHLASAGLERGWTIAHAVHLTEAEVLLLANSGAGVAHCPTSNLKLGSGIADVARLRAARIPVALGSDGAPCNNRLDPFREMALAALLPRRGGDPGALSARTALAMATIEGARAIGLDGVTGSLVPGKRADVIVLDPGFPPTAPSADPYATVVFSASPANVRDVLCDGEILKRDFRPVRYDSREVAARGSEAAEKLLARAW